LQTIPSFQYTYIKIQPVHAILLYSATVTGHCNTVHIMELPLT
jgi:hypothetical protein